MDAFTKEKTFNFAEAVTYAGVSRHRLHQAIKKGELPCLGGGKPGTLMEIRERDLIRWCREHKVILPPTRKRIRPVRIEDLQRQYETMLEGFEDILQTMRSLWASLYQLQTTLRVLTETINMKIDRLPPPFQDDDERTERSVSEG